MNPITKTVLTFFLLSSFICSLGRSVYSTHSKQYSFQSEIEALQYFGYSVLSDDCEDSESIPFIPILSEEWEPEEEHTKKKINSKKSHLSNSDYLTNHINAPPSTYGTLSILELYRSPLFLLHEVFRL